MREGREKFAELMKTDCCATDDATVQLERAEGRGFYRPPLALPPFVSFIPLPSLLLLHLPF